MPFPEFIIVIQIELFAIAIVIYALFALPIFFCVFF